METFFARLKTGKLSKNKKYNKIRPFPAKIQGKWLILWEYRGSLPP